MTDLYLADGGSGCSGITCLVNGVGSAIGGAAGGVNFWSDPWGNSFKSLQDSARNLSQTVLPTITKATLPDLTAD